MKCSNCETANAPDTTKCHQCGEVFPLICNSCGTVYLSGDEDGICDNGGCSSAYLDPLIGFVSYRRKYRSYKAPDEDNNVAARIKDRVEKVLSARRIPGGFFFDKQGIEREDFEQKIARAIQACSKRVFLLILTPGALDKRGDEDWMRKEIALAIKHQLEIIPVIASNYRKDDDFDWPNDLPDEIKPIQKINVKFSYLGNADELSLTNTIARIADEIAKTLTSSPSKPSKISNETITAQQNNIVDATVNQPIEQGLIPEIKSPFDSNNIISSHQHLDDDDLLKHFDNTPEFKLLRASWSAETLEAFCKLARAVNAAGLDWWRVGKVTVKFGRKNPGSERAVGVVGVIRGRRTRTVSLLRSVSGIVKLNREPLTLALASKLEIAIAAESFEEWKLQENERPGLWPDQLLGEDEDESGVSDTYEAQDEDAQIGGQLNEIPENNVSESNHETTNANVTWPSVGHDFLKAIKQNLDVSLLPFTPVEIADNESIEDTNQAFWKINDKHLISVWFDAKSRRSGKVTVLWGFYSSYEKRDPVFRKACDDICAIPNSLNENGYFSLNNYAYNFFSDGYLGFETSDRPTFEQMSDAIYIKHITDQLIAFSLKIWPAIS